MTAKTAKYSPAMREALRALFVESTLDGEGVKASYWVNASTAAALRVRGAITPITSTRFGLTEIGAEAISEDYSAMVDRAHEQALIDNANFRRCPLADEGCDFVAFGRPATPFGDHREITSDDQIVYHLNQGHIPMGNALFIPSIAHLSDEHRANAADFVEAYRKAKAHDARTGVGTGTSEARCRRAKREGTLVYVEGSEGRIDDVAVLGGVKFHVTGFNLDGWYYPNQITVYDAPALPASHCESDEPHDAHDWSYFGPAAFHCDGVKPEAVATPDYAVSVPVDVEHCANNHAHHPHAWSYLGPEVSHFCDGTFQLTESNDEKPLCAGHPNMTEAILCDGRCAVADEADERPVWGDRFKSASRVAADEADEEEPTTWVQYHENHPEVAASWGEQNGRPVNCSCLKCDPHGRQPKADIIVDELPSLFPGGTPVRTYADGSLSVGPYQELPELHGPIADDHGHAVAEEAEAHVRAALGDNWPGRYVRLEYVADGNLGFITEGVTV